MPTTTVAAPSRDRRADDLTADDAVFAARGLTVHDDASGDGRRVLEVPDKGLSRLGPDLGRLVDVVLAADGAEITPRQIAVSLGAPWTADIVLGALGPLIAIGAVTPFPPTAADIQARRKPRLTFRPPLVVQYTLLDPQRMFSSVRRCPWVFTGRVVPSLAVAIGLLGLPFLAFLGGAPDGPLTTPVGAGLLWVVLAAVVAGVALHELAHGAALTAYGGRCRRMGVMLFYLAPALFCDVTDGWRLAPAARVRIALAGIVTQCSLAGLAAVTAACVDGSLQQGLALFSLLTYLFAVVNLVPFVKLDGYIALAGALDHPYLRRDTIEALTSAVRRRVLGAPNEPPARLPGWAPWFGLMAVLTPVYLVASALAALAQVLVADFGAAGAVLTLAALVAAGLWACRGIARFCRVARAGGVARWRLAAALGVLLALIAGCGSLVHVPLRVDGGLSQTADGAAVVAVTLAQPAARIVGREAEVGTSGALFRQQAGVRVRTGRQVRPCRVAIEGLTPVRSDATIAARCVAARVDGPLSRPLRHHVRVDGGDISVAAWLWERYAAPSTRLLW